MKSKNLSLTNSLFLYGCILLILSLFYNYLCKLSYTPRNVGIYYSFFVGGMLLLAFALYYFLQQKKDPHLKFFRVTGLCVDGIYPYLQSKEAEGNSTRYKYSLPLGMSTEDFEKKKLALEQHLGASITIEAGRKATFTITTTINE